MSFSSYTPIPDRLTTWLPPFALPFALPTLTVIFWFALLSAVLHGGIRERVVSIIFAWPFFTRRYDFLKSNFEKTGKNFFSFKIMQVRCSASVPFS
jgi:sterol 14-demethylase